MGFRTELLQCRLTPREKQEFKDAVAIAERVRRGRPRPPGAVLRSLVIAYSIEHWHSDKIEKPEVIKFWLGASSFLEAIQESHDFVHSRGAHNMSMWAADDWCNLWISGDGVQLELELLPSVSNCFLNRKRKESIEPVSG